MNAKLVQLKSVVSLLVVKMEMIFQLTKFPQVEIPLTTYPYLALFHYEGISSAKILHWLEPVTCHNTCCFYGSGARTSSRRIPLRICIKWGMVSVFFNAWLELVEGQLTSLYRFYFSWYISWMVAKIWNLYSWLSMDSGKDSMEEDPSKDLS